MIYLRVKDHQVIKLEWVMITRKIIKAQSMEYIKVIKIQKVKHLPFRDLSKRKKTR